MLDIRGASDPALAARKGIELGFDFLLVGPDELFPKMGSAELFFERDLHMSLIVDGEGDLDAVFAGGRRPAAVLVGESVSAASDPAFAAADLKRLIRSALRRSNAA